MISCPHPGDEVIRLSLEPWRLRGPLTLNWNPSEEFLFDRGVPHTFVGTPTSEDIPGVRRPRIGVNIYGMREHRKEKELREWQVFDITWRSMSCRDCLK
ncbi:hypothetical protein TNCT_90351 [Trichonephila clavata]|uniref:Uncharacterized protein n=1 Tax=Trichonephila clavata TaxID=2740835 RepID=A0A8X6K8H5_TRICU|nr:hypothetical protein TNCT_90351 [Trichonephila clavata]